MNLSRCDKGHFFDKEKYATCPHCQGGAGADDSLTTVFTEDMTAAGPVVTDPTPAPVPTPPVDIPPASESTLPIGGTPVEQPTVPSGAIMGGDTVPLTDNVMPHDFKTVPIDENFVGASDDDHTVAFYDDIFSDVAGSSNVVNAPGAPAQANTISSPCVGWLIALGGAHIGQDYHLKVGKNFIGRDAQMDIALTGDKSVSRNRHAIVVYEPKQHLYLVQPGDSSGLVYRNNEVVLSPVKLEAYDMITVGEVNLLFMPLCGERFNWSTLLEELSKKND